MLNKDLLNYTHFVGSKVNLFPILRVYWDPSLHLSVSQSIEMNIGSLWILVPAISPPTPVELYAKNLINASTLNTILVDDLPSTQIVGGF